MLEAKPVIGFDNHAKNTDKNASHELQSNLSTTTLGTEKGPL